MDSQFWSHEQENKWWVSPPLYSPLIKSEAENDDFYHAPKHEKSLKRERDDDE